MQFFWRGRAFVGLGILLIGSAWAHESSRPEGDAREGGPEECQGESCRLRIELNDPETGAALPGMIRLRDPDGEAVGIPELFDRCVGLPGEARKLGWHVVTGPVEITAPQSKVTIEAVSGLERNSATREIDMTGKAEASAVFQLRRFWDTAGRGRFSGNTHLHLKDLSREEADRYLREVPRGDGLDVVFVSYLERAIVDRTYITNAHSREDLEALSTNGLKFGNAEEYRHNFGGGGEGYGHVMFLDLPERVLPASVGPGITKQGHDGIPLRPGIENARGQGATIVWCHNSFGFEDIPSWNAGLVDAQNIHDGGNRGSYEDSFYRYLNLGMRVPFSTGTDWFIYDFSRVYADLGGKGGTVENWLEALRAGRTFITNGPLLEFSAGNQEPGGEIGFGEPIVLRYRAVGRHDFGSLELVLNGVAVKPGSVEYREHSGWFEAAGKTVLKLSEPSWIALRTSPDMESTNEFGRKLFAHTSPVYVKSGDQRSSFQPETAREVIAEIKANLSEIEKNGKFSTGADRKTVEAIYRTTIEKLEAKIAKSGK